MVSLISTQTEMLSKQVYLIEKLSNIQNEKRELSLNNNARKSHLKCLILVRPTLENINKLTLELSSPRYGDYYLSKYDVND